MIDSCIQIHRIKLNDIKARRLQLAIITYPTTFAMVFIPTSVDKTLLSSSPCHQLPKTPRTPSILDKLCPHSFAAADRLPSKKRVEVQITTHAEFGWRLGMIIPGLTKFS
jgi:hypothetical protein